MISTDLCKQLELMAKRKGHIVSIGFVAKERSFYIHSMSRNNATCIPLGTSRREATERLDEYLLSASAYELEASDSETDSFQYTSKTCSEHDSVA